VLGSTLRVQGGGPAAAAAAAQWGRRAADGTFEVTARSHAPAFPTPQSDSRFFSQRSIQVKPSYMLDESFSYLAHANHPSG
jgi:hypothetical protein